MDIRMLPIRHVFERFPRLVRDLARQQGKEIELILEGEATRIDKAIIDEIGEPLVHMIRNSVDHGIETPAERVARGKTPTGTILLSATQESNHVLITIMDDGVGHRRGAGAPQGGRARPAARRRAALRARAGAARLRAGLLHRRPGERPLRPRRRARRGPEVHRAAQRPGGGRDGSRRGHQVHHPASADPRHHLGPAGGGRRPHLRDPARLGGGEPEAAAGGDPPHQRPRGPAHPRADRAGGAPGRAVLAGRRRRPRRAATW